MMRFSDKLHDAIERYNEAYAAANACPTSLEGTAEEAELHASVDNIGSGEHIATTAPGAMAALRLLKKEAADFAGSDMSKALIDGAMSYFEGIEADKDDALLNGIRMVEDMPSLEKAQGSEWMAISDALGACVETLSGVIAQPRSWDGQTLNTAGEYLEAIEQFLMFEQRRVIAEAAACKRPESASDRVLRLRAIFTWKTEDACELTAPQLEDLIAQIDRMEKEGAER